MFASVSRKTRRTRASRLPMRSSSPCANLNEQYGCEVMKKSFVNIWFEIKLNHQPSLITLLVVVICNRSLFNWRCFNRCYCRLSGVCNLLDVIVFGRVAQDTSQPTQRKKSISVNNSYFSSTQKFFSDVESSAK